jgi:hypothetical protein
MVPGAEKEDLPGIGREPERPVRRIKTRLVVPVEEGERMRRPGQGSGIGLAAILDHLAGATHRLPHLVLRRPALGRAQDDLASQNALSCGEAGVERQGAAEQAQRLLVVLALRPAMRQRPQVKVVGAEAFRRLGAHPLHLGRAQAGLDRAGHRLGHAVLQREDVAEVAVEVLPPKTWRPVAVSLSCTAMRMRPPALRTLPSST